MWTFCLVEMYPYALPKGIMHSDPPFSMPYGTSFDGKIIILELEGLINRTADRCCFILLRQSRIQTSLSL